MPKWISLGRADGYQAPDKATAASPREDSAETMALPVTAAPPAVEPHPAPAPAQPSSAQSPPSETTVPAGSADDAVVDLKRRQAQLSARVAELQFDLGGLVYEMAIRDRIRVDVIVKRAAAAAGRGRGAVGDRADPPSRGDLHGGLVRKLRRAALERSGVLLAVRAAAPPAGAAQRDRLNAKLGLAELPGDVVARPRIRRVARRSRRCRRTRSVFRHGRGPVVSRLKNAVRSATRAACCMLWVTITIV